MIYDVHFNSSILTNFHILIGVILNLCLNNVETMNETCDINCIKKDCVDNFEMYDCMCFNALNFNEMYCDESYEEFNIYSKNIRNLQILSLMFILVNIIFNVILKDVEYRHNENTDELFLLKHNFHDTFYEKKTHAFYGYLNAHISKKKDYIYFLKFQIKKLLQIVGLMVIFMGITFATFKHNKFNKHEYAPPENSFYSFIFESNIHYDEHENIFTTTYLELIKSKNYDIYVNYFTLNFCSLVFCVSMFLINALFLSLEYFKIIKNY